MTGYLFESAETNKLQHEEIFLIDFDARRFAVIFTNHRKNAMVQSTTEMESRRTIAFNVCNSKNRLLAHYPLRIYSR